VDKVAIMPAADRAALFNQAGAARGLANAIIEKDFWVCWTLKRLFGIQGEDSPGLVFKGGTSLSKGYDAIRRFSEDIDLSFDRADLGYGGDRDPEAAPSRKKAEKLIDDLVADVEKHTETVVLPRLSAAIERELGPAAEAGWSLKIDPGEPQKPACSVDVLALRRTFWEKATALHVEITATSNPRHRNISLTTITTSRRWRTPTTARRR